MSSRKFFFLFLGMLSFALSLGVMAYWVPREDFWVLFGTYSILFVSYLAINHYGGKWEGWFRPLLAFALFCRVILLFAVPTLSDDFYRFIWDGHILLHGLNPYKYLPFELLDTLSATDPSFYKELISQLNSPNYYSVYPPLNQVVFAMAAWLGGQDVLITLLVIRGVLFIFDLGVIYLLHKLTLSLHLPRKTVLLYALNPLVLLEIFGNLHFEGIMLFFVLAAVYFIDQQPKMGGISMGTAIGVKLTPLLLVPVFFWFLPSKKKWGFMVGVFLTGGLLMAPLFLEESYFYYLQSLKLYHGKFEFNASVYYLIREILMIGIGFNPIAVLSPVLTAVTLILILRISFNIKKEKRVLRLLEISVVLYLTYLILHTVVHPWYLIVPLGLSVLGNQRYFLAWSYLAFLSYGNYQSDSMGEIWWLLLIQYGFLAIFIWRDSPFIRKNVLIC